jgi:hypothetical protein
MPASFTYAAIWGVVDLDRQPASWSSVSITPNAGATSVTIYFNWGDISQNTQGSLFRENIGPFSATISVGPPPTFTLEIVDAFDFLSMQSKTPQAFITPGRERVGVVADGTARLLLRGRAAAPGTLAVSLQGSGDPRLDGKIVDAFSGALVTQVQTNEIAPNLHVGYAVYVAPEDYTVIQSDSTSLRNISLGVTYTGGAGTQTTSQTLNVVRPPLILAHGLWSDGYTAWSTVAPGNSASFLQGIRSAIPGIRVYLADYSAKNASAFVFNSRVINDTITGALRFYDTGHIAAAQADVIGHSMGGILSRIWAGSPAYKNNIANYKQGNIHKLITFDSPHLGSFRADELVDFRDALDPVTRIA